MNSKSETGYGARLGNAQKLVAALQNFTTYQPVKPEYSIEALTNLIGATKTMNDQVAEKKQAYSLAVENRIKAFEKDPNALEKLLSPINGAVKSIYGRSSKEAEDLAAIIAKFRGANIKKASANPEEESVSQSYQSYSSKAQFFADIIVNLNTFGRDYEPLNADLRTPGLEEAYNKAIAANNAVMSSFTQFSKKITDRSQNYSEMSQTALRIKDSIKAQFGLYSTEYRLVKGLRI